MKRISFIVLLTSLTVTATSQPSNPGLEVTRNQFQAKQVIPPSPEAASLGKYGNVPISLFTGTPSVSVPLVELKGSFITLPVSLSYNSNGFKPEEIAPWTGLGWSLNAGGVITRSVMGDPDMEDNYFRWLSPVRTVPSDEYEKRLYFDSVRNKYLETQGDVYYYNFMGHSGRFMIHTDGTIIEKEKNYLTITCSTSPTISSNWMFTITDENGFVYEFTEVETTLSTPTDDQPNAPPLTARQFYSAWYLSKITAPNGLEELTFEYYAPIYAQSTQSGTLSNNSVTYTKEKWCDNSVIQNGSGGMYYFQPPAVNIYKKFIKKATLKKNSVTIGYIDFESDLNARVDLGDADFDGERMLKKVKLYNTTNSVNTLVQQFNLGYGYFGISQAESPGYYRRLMLKTVREMSTDSTLTPNKPPYTFYYNSETATMPGRYSSGVDHWGYYNGANNTYGSLPTLIPTLAVGIGQFVGNYGLGANREANGSYAVYTVLDRIDYPTGGYTTFSYEGNAALVGSSVMGVGGLRIREMVDHSFASTAAIVKKYEYLAEDGTSSGIITSLPNYLAATEWEDLSNCPCWTSRLMQRWGITISASSTFGLGTVQGSHIGYGRVTEYQVDLATDKSLGKTVYTYDYLSSNEMDYHIGNGELLKQQTYDNGGKLLQEVVNTYAYEDYENVRGTVRKLFSDSYSSSATTLYRKTVGTTKYYLYLDPMACTNPPSGYAALLSDVPLNNFIEDYMPQQRKKLTTKVTRKYNGFTNNYATYTKNFTYGNTDHAYPTLIEETDSKNDKVFTVIKYVADYTISCSPATGSMAAAITDMQAKNMMGLPVEKLQYRDNSAGTNRRYLSGEVIQYKSGLPEKIYYLQASPMPTSVTASTASCTSTQSIDANYRLVATLTYDSYMNLREESKTNDIVTTYFWGYDNRYPVAKVLGKSLSQSLGSGVDQSVLTTAASESAINTELNKLRTLTGALVSTHIYKPMVGMISAKDARGQLVNYEYDELNRLVHVKDNTDIVKNFRYNYGLGTVPTKSGTSLYYNTALESTLARNNCSAEPYGETVVYKVPYGKHAATTQTEADNLAAIDLAANAQIYANLVGRCGWKNAAANQTFYSSTCTYEQGPPLPINYNVPFGKYFSAVSQLDANAMAAAEIASLGQAYANSSGTCSCVDMGYKYINGTCELGTIINGGLAATYENGQWRCYYYYRWSDSSTSEYYSFLQPDPCPIDP